LASRSAERAEAFSRKFALESVVGYEGLLDSQDLDAVYIPLPNGLHAKWVEYALDRGLHVLVEKSLGCSFEEVNRLNDLAESRGLVLLENFQFRFHRQMSRVIDILKSGELGELRAMRSSFGFPPFPDASNIRYDSALGGGSLLDAGAYTLKISQLILGLDIEVLAANLFRTTGHEVDIFGGAHLRQQGGNAFSQVAFGFDQQYQCNLELWGSRGHLFTDRIFTAPPGHTCKISIETGPRKKVIEVEPDDHFQAMLRHFYDLIQGLADRKREYLENRNQSRLIADVFAMAN